jgi:hypothetical protein
MERVTRFWIRLVALVVFLALVTYLAVHRNGLTANEAVGETVGEAVSAGRMALRDGYAMAATLALVALFGFVAWTVLRAHKRGDKATPSGDGVGSTDGGTSRHG